MGTLLKCNSISWRVSLFMAMLSLAAILQAGLPTTTLAQPYLTRGYAIEDGLIQSQAVALHQDKDGYLWIGTHGGISRFDGLNFNSYTIDDGLISNRTQALQEDRSGQLWAGSTNGITIFGPNGFEYLTTKEGLIDNNINDLLLASDGNMWIATQSGVSTYDGKKFRHYTTHDGLVSSVITSIEEAQNGDIWVTTSQGVCALKKDQFTCHTTEDGLPHPFVTDMLIDSRRRTWASTQLGTALLSVDGLSEFIPRNDLPVESTNALLEDSQGAIWIGTREGVVRLDSTGRQTHSWLGGNWIATTLFEDNERNIWAGTLGRGVIKFQQTAFSHMNPELDFPKDVYLGVFEDSQYRIWAGAMTNGLYRLGLDGVKHFDTEAYPLTRHIRSIAEDNNGTLWFGSGYGVSRYDGKDFKTYTTQEGLSNDYVYSIMPDHQNQIWVGTINGLNVLKGDSVDVIDLDIGKNQQTVFALYEDINQRVWIGTAQGLMYYEDNQLTKIEALAGRPISSILKDPAGDLWLGTLGYGVYRLNTSAGAIVDTLNTSHGLNAGTVYFTKFDGLGDLWIGTSKGVNQLDAEAYRMEGVKQIRSFGKEDGIVGMETNTNAATLDHQGRLWFGTIDAVINYDASSRPVNETAPPVEVTGVRLFLEPTDLETYTETDQPSQQATVVFPHQENHLTFDFVGLSYTTPELVTYQYRLAGFDEDWQKGTTSRFVTYANLAPGKYTFEVSAINSDGLLSAKPASLAFTVSPPFWQTPWFISLSILSLILGIAGLIQLRTNTLQKRGQKLEEKVAQRTEDLKNTHADLLEAREEALQAAKSKSTFISSMTHELRTPMNGIMGMAQVLTVTNMDEEQEDCAQTIIECSTMMMEIIENLLSFADLAAGKRTVSTERFSLTDLLNETVSAIRAQSNTKQLETRYFLAPAVPREIVSDREHTRQILHHLLSNAVKFTQSGMVFIEVKLEQGTKKSNLIFSVHDTGIGMEEHQLKRVFDAFSQADMSMSRQFQGTGIGLALVQQITSLLDGKLSAKSWPGIGSSFHFSLPLGPNQIPALIPENNPYTLNGKCIMIVVEDEREQRRLALMCTSIGMSVVRNTQKAADVDIIIADPVNVSKTVRYPKAALVLLHESDSTKSAGTILAPEAPGEEIERVLQVIASEKVI
ncbi:MAG: two-component regulator propeller domain-containing protein [Rhodothermales bacterium]